MVSPDMIGMYVCAIYGSSKESIVDNSAPFCALYRVGGQLIDSERRVWISFGTFSAYNLQNVMHLCSVWNSYEYYYTEFAVWNLICIALWSVQHANMVLCAHSMSSIVYTKYIPSNVHTKYAQSGYLWCLQIIGHAGCNSLFSLRVCALCFVWTSQTGQQTD